MYFKNIRRNALKFRSMITTEPCVSLYLIGMFISLIANQNLLLDKTCRVNLRYGDALCDALNRRDTADNSSKAADVEVQKYVTRLNSIGRIFQLAVAFGQILLWGAWSDRHNLRKPLILLPILGELVKNLCLLLCVYIEETNAEIVFAVENFLPLLFGHWTVLSMGIFAHIMDSTKPEDHTTKVAFCNVFVTLGDPIGTALSGILLKKTGFYGVFSITAILLILGLLHGIFRVKEVVKERSEPEQITVAEKPKRLDLILDWFNFKGLSSILSVITRQRKDKKRKMLFLCYLLIFFGWGPSSGQNSINYLFTRYKFNYGEIEYSIFGTVTSIFGTIAIVTIMFLNNRFFHMNDYGLAITGIVFAIGSSVAFGLSQVSRDFYIAGAIDSGNSILSIAHRAAMMKLVDGDEAAKSNALISAQTVTFGLLFAILYNTVYNLTLSFYAGIVYFISTFFYTISLGIAIALYFIFKTVTIRSSSQVLSDSIVKPDVINNEKS